MSARYHLSQAHRDATISECGRFRYWLGRHWSDKPALLFVMLNPSTADAEVDDATIRRCTTFAVAHGFGALEVVNLFAYRATDPADLRRAGWPVGPENDTEIARAARRCASVCVAWGAVGDTGPSAERVQVVAPILRAAGKPLQCLKITRSGFPQHPLYLASACRLHDWDENAIQEAGAALT